jgi:uncharacterized membrane protein YdjX (TVP38/TMEM64 family)
VVDAAVPQSGGRENGTVTDSPVRKPSLVNAQVVLRGLVLIATLVAVGVLIEGLGLKSMLETGWIDHEVRGHGLHGIALFVAVTAVFVALGLPRQVPSFLAGYAFGFVEGAALAVVATTLGAAGCFFYARFMGRDALTRRFPHRIRKIDDVLAGNELTMALVLRLSPFTNNLATNLAAGVSGVRPMPFFLGSLAGFLPQTVIFALLGSGFNLDPVLRTSISVVLFVLSTILGIWLWRRTRRAQGLPEEA